MTTTMTPTSKRVKLAEVKAHKRNYNRHPAVQVERIAISLRKFGQVRSIVVWRNTILAGHGVVEAAKSLGWREIAADVLPDEYPEHLALAYVAADNELGRLADPDQAALAAILEESKTADAELMAAIGYNNAEFQALLKEVAKETIDTRDAEPQIDRAEELRAKWGVEFGQLWQLGEHRLICGDCTDAPTVARVMGEERAELCFTSPPYLDMRDYSGNDLSLQTLLGFVPQSVAVSNFQVVNLGMKFHDGEVVIWWNDYLDEFKRCGNKLLAWNVWDKNGQVSMAAATNMFYITHEWLFVFGKNRKKLNRTIPNNLDAYANQYGKNFLSDGMPKLVRQKDGTTKKTTSKIYTHHQLHSVVRQTSELGSIRADHPATFPTGLPSKYVEAMTDPSQIVYEPFLGSGTTLIACENLKRRCYALEIHPPYVAVALERWSTTTGRMPIKID